MAYGGNQTLTQVMADEGSRGWRGERDEGWGTTVIDCQEQTGICRSSLMPDLNLPG